MSRSAKTMIAYIPDTTATVTFTTAGGYTHAGFVFNWREETWDVEVKGYSPRSIAKRAKAVARERHRLLTNGVPAHPDYISSMTAVARLYEVTAPVIAKYFGDHRVIIGAIFRPESGWEEGSWLAGRSSLRCWAKEGVTAVAVHRAGRVADFQMTEIVKSLDSRKAAV